MRTKSEIVGVLLAFFLGAFGAHRFYLGQPVAAVIYLILSPTGISAVAGIVEAFFMPRRVRAYNASREA